MRSLVAVEFLSVDGVMQGLGSPEEDTEGGFAHGGWGLAYGAAMHEALPDGPSRTEAFLLGRRTYEQMAQFWPHQPDSSPMAAQLNATTKHVATRTLTDFGWAHTRRLEGELAPAVAALKQEGDGDLVVLGSGRLVAQLIAADLVDEYQLFIHPLLLGSGKRLFPGLPAPRSLRLAHVATTSLGTVALTYSTR